MSELMVMQQEYIDWLNQSKLHQFLPFIVLSTATLIYTAIFTKIDAFYVVIITYNPFSFAAYWMAGVMPFMFIPMILFFTMCYLLVMIIQHLKTRRNSV